MKKLFTLALSAMLIMNMTFAQNTVSSKKQERARTPYSVSFKGVSAITGGITSNTMYIPGTTMALNFELTYSSPDLEWVDGFSMTFPTGITPQEVGTTISIDDANLVTPITGQTIAWGEITTPTGIGDIYPGTYPFTISVTIDATVSGNQTISYFIMGDAYSQAAPPHSINGTLTLLEAASDDVGVASVDINSFYQPAAVVVPMATVQNFGSQAQTFDVSFTIDDGTSNVFTDTFNVANLAAGATQQITFANSWTATLGNFNAVAETHLVGDAGANNNVKAKTILVADVFTSYAWNAVDPDDIVPEGPVEVLIPAGMITSIVPSNLNFIAGADFVNSQWIGAEYNSGGNSKIYDIDINTGATTLIGATGVSITGLAYDVTTSTLYASTYANSASSLYSIDEYTGASTLIGPMGSASGLIIGIACNNNGDLFGISLNDTLFSINKTTGTATPVGPLGIDIAYAQDIAYDRDNNILYGTLYTAQGGLLGQINTTTGAVTTLSTFDLELTGFAIPYAFTLPDNDVMVQAIQAIASGCNLSDSVSIVITVKNIGNDTQTDIPVYYTINGGTQVTGTIAGPLATDATTTYTFTQHADLSNAGVYTIVACTDLTNDDNNNNDCKTITVNNIAPSSIPYTMGFEANEDVSGWKIQDINSDTYSWEIIDFQDLARTGSGLAIYEYNENMSANDWLISTCIELQGGVDYDLSFWYKVGSWSGQVYPEKMKVAIGGTQASTALTQVIVDLGTINNDTYQNNTSTFSVPATGAYYIGWHAYSAADMFYIALDDINLDIASSINETLTASSIKVFPNPAQNFLNVTSTQNITAIKVINTLGQTISYNQLDALNYVLNTSNFNYGVYFIEIETAEGTTTKRFVIAQ